MSLFDGVEVEPQATSLGGVHGEVIRAYGSGNGSGMSWRGSVLALWGIPTRGTKGWRSSLKQRATLRQISDAVATRNEHTIVSRQVDGMWLTGAGDHPRSDVVQILHSLGFEAVEDREMEYQRVERYRR